MRRIVRGVLRSAHEPIETTLVGGFLLSTQTVLPVVLLLGYLMRVLALTAGDDTVSVEFGDWRRLASDGGKAFLVWMAYGAVPLVVLYVWVYSSFYLTDGFTTPGSYERYRVVNGVIGTTLTSPIAVNDLYLAVIDDPPHLLGDETEAVLRPPYPFVDTVLLERVSLRAFLFVTALHAYVTPAALAHVSRTGSIRSGFDHRSIGSVIVNRTYLTNWTVAAVLWALGSTAQLGWLALRWRLPGNDWELQSVGVVPVVAIPTVSGVVSTGALLLAAFVGFPLLVIGYALVGRAYGEIHR